MTAPCYRRHCGVLFVLIAMSFFAVAADAAELLVADRLTNRVYRYSDSGSFLGILLDDAVNLAEPNGMALSPDNTKLYVASRNNGRVVRYDYNGTTATNPTVIINSGLDLPASLLFSAGQRPATVL
jgi:DNA-binding beta-propeller fold protein YncE